MRRALKYRATEHRDETVRATTGDPDVSTGIRKCTYGIAVHSEFKLCTLTGEIGVTGTILLRLYQTLLDQPLRKFTRRVHQDALYFQI